MPSVGSSIDPFRLPELVGTAAGNSNYAGRTPVDKALVGGENTAIFLTFGDSSMSNTVNSIYIATQAKNQNFDVYNGGLYATVEPLLGCQINSANLSSGCFFTRVCDSLIVNGIFTRVIHAPMAVGGSLIADYAAPGSVTGAGAVSGRIAASYLRLVANGLAPTHVYIRLGKNDAATSQANATAGYASIILTLRNLGFIGPIYVARNSLNGVVAANVQAAHAAILDTPGKVYTGGDMDSLTSAGNYWDSKIHENATGAAASAALAVTAITANVS